MQGAKTYIPYFIFVVFCIYLPASCRKSNSYTIPTSSTYRFAEYTDFKPIRAFTNSGEILDSGVLAELFSYDSMFLAQSLIQQWADIPAYDSLYFGANDTGIAYDYSVGNWEFTTQRSGNNLTLVAVHPQAQDIDTTVISAIDSAIVFYPYLLSNRQYDGGPFYRYNWTYRGFGTQTAEDKIVMPAMISAIEEPVVGFASGVYNNRFNPAFNFRMMPDGDTLIFREFSMVMQKE
ncbi:MAG TPA: hypothetical protein VKR53_11780 [Puia sp.]|nr:hypothetical protein [Puia sp.]